MGIFNENSLYSAIILMWGENGAHAEVFRDICKKAGVELAEFDISLDDQIRILYEKFGRNKVRTMRALRDEYQNQGFGYLGLREAKTILDRVIG